MKRTFHTSQFASRTALALALAAGLASAGAGAEDQLPATSAAQPSSVSEDSLTPQIRQNNGVNYLTGGIGLDAREQIMPLVRDMNLQLVFAEKQSGAYVADVDVRIADSSGREVLTVEKSDPLVFAQLQPGTYEVSATVNGETIERKVTVSSRGQRTEVFHWG